MIHEINDFITYNLNIRQFTEDVISGCEGPELLRSFYEAISAVTVLDPTCGSGAFLFAALNILEPLYSVCLDRMQAFVEDMERSGERHSPRKFEDFRKVLAEVDRHPNRTYFILKSIIVNNLYGVDIMEEAVEICKLRLFLKLVAQVDKAKELEPLPDIDFNIRTGNTLVGYISLEDIKSSAEKETSGQGKLLFGQTEKALQRVREEAEVVERAYRKFHQMQTEYGMDAGEFSDQKQVLREKLNTLKDKLDRYLAKEYGVDPEKSDVLKKWQANHQPFHWFAEFYRIMRSGGFDVIIGNPPWVEYAKVKRKYMVLNYESESCGNLHTLCTEQSLRVRSTMGRFSFIVQLPLTNSSRMEKSRHLLHLKSANLWVLSFDDRPGKLFEGLQHCRAAIFVSHGKSDKAINTNTYVSFYQRWYSQVRGVLFQLFEFARLKEPQLIAGHFAKTGSDTASSVFEKILLMSNDRVSRFVSPRVTKSFLFYQEATQYWVKATVGIPYYSKGGKVGEPAHGRYIYINNRDMCCSLAALMNSSLFYIYFIAYGDCFHLSDKLVKGFQVTDDLLADSILVTLGKDLDKDLRTNAVRQTIKTKLGYEISYDEFYAGQSKLIIDKIDQILTQHYGFTDEELDFIINYDIK